MAVSCRQRHLYLAVNTMVFVNMCGRIYCDWQKKHKTQRMICDIAVCPFKTGDDRSRDNQT